LNTRFPYKEADAAEHQLLLARGMKPSELSKELREGQSPFLQARRTLVALSFLGVAIGKIVSLYQIGIIKHLPDPPLDVFDSDKVDASDYAYKRFATPDAFLMVLTYGTTAWLAGAGREDRAEKTPLWVQLMFGKIALDIGTNLMLAREEWAENKKLCFYCQSATVLSILSLIVAWPEFKKSIRK
jgi:uncharacterized membrane protein